ncbi:MAG: hypothetical protein ACE5JX_00960, partial [Acidobacteriota bacterium]
MRNRAPLWMISSDYDSLLILNNSLPRQLSTRVVLYDEGGKEVGKKDLLLAPRQTEILSLSESFSLADSVSRGSLAVYHSGLPRDIGAQVEIVKRATSATTDVACFEPEDFSSTSLAAVAASSPGEPESRLILANTSQEPRTFEIRAEGASQRRATLQPRQSLSLPLSELSGASEVVAV